MENYSQALEWLFSQLPNYQNIGGKAYKPGLQNITLLCEALGNPHQQFPSIHIAGTNGKGSTCHALSSVLQAQGYTVGLFTSPHLVHFTERIKVNGKECDEGFVMDFISTIRDQELDITPSFFELTAAMAFQYFAQQNVDIAIIETGLGGRLDATNVLSPLLCGITSIGYDHQNFLGNTLEEIAGEKAGIIKKNTPVVVGIQQYDVEQVFIEKAKEFDAPIILVQEKKTYQTDLLGVHQQENMTLVVTLLQQLKKWDWKIDDTGIEKGLQQIVKNTGLRGRFEKIAEQPDIILDTAHNKDGLQRAFEKLQEEKYSQLYAILGFVKDKNIQEILALLPKQGNYYFVKPTIFRGLSPIDYKKDIEAQQLKYTLCEDISSALLEVQEKAVQTDVIYIGGSNFVVADYLSIKTNNSPS